jgi:hypothetical protein
MRNRSLRIAAPIVVGITAAALVATGGTGVAAEPRADTAVQAATVSAENAQYLRPLLELRTGGGTRFYTLSAAEAARAVTAHKFTPTTETAGLFLYNQKVPGTVAVHRLRLAGPKPAYVLVTNEGELTDLRDNTDDAWDLRYEGVVGWIHSNPTPGTVDLHRFSKDGDWRVARADRKDLPAHGYHDDGRLGFAPVG